MRPIKHSVKKIDQLGRLGVPKDLREMLGMKPGALVEFDIDEDSIIIRRSDAHTRCALTGEKATFSLESGIRLSESGCLRLIDELRSII